MKPSVRYRPLAIEQRLIEVFSKDMNFLEKVAEFDEVFDEHIKFDELREVFFDLLMINFFTSDVNKLEEDYLESREWEKIEDETIDRGTELLNLLLYINECHDEQIKPGLEDFLKDIPKVMGKRWKPWKLIGLITFKTIAWTI